MKQRKTLKIGTVGWTLGLMSLLAAVGLFTTPAPEPTPGGAAAEVAAWGSEALSPLEAGLAALSPIRPANACGLGASSCFKCHNGKRAAAPSIGTPWHDQHSKVNFSCTGCHEGNPRLMKQEMAHRGLIANPVEQPATCAGCHQDGNAEELAGTYKNVGKGE